jgi:hypothetical protein
LKHRLGSICGYPVTLSVLDKTLGNERHRSARNHFAIAKVANYQPLKNTALISALLWFKKQH